MPMVLSQWEYDHIREEGAYEMMCAYRDKFGKRFPPYNWSTYPDGVDQFLRALRAALAGEDMDEILIKYAVKKRSFEEILETFKETNDK